jgi:hypothetical protein
MRGVYRFRAGRLAADAIGLLIVLYLCSQIMACSKLGVGYRSVLLVRNAGDATSKALAVVAEAGRTKCKAKHKIKTAGYATCIKPYLNALEKWRLYVKTSVNTALAAAFGVLEVARARKKKKAPWLEALKPGACALVLALKQWRELMPKDAKSLLTLLVGVEGLVCK